MKSSRRPRLASNGTSKRSKSTPMSPPKPRAAQPQSESSPAPFTQSSVPKPQQPQTQSATTTTTTHTITNGTTTATTATASLTADARYQKNLNSLRRIDPTIISIIDQFSHICLYRLHEGKWQKDGFEGASFLFERAAYPPYGLFILNRAGMHDYIHPIHPEDEIQPTEGEYLMYRSYPEFTAKRLAMTKSAPRTLTQSWTDARHRTPSANDPLTNWRHLLNQKPDKGPYETVMFWFLGSDSEQHEPLSDTIERLMAFIRKGEPYPYNLDRPPPRVRLPPSTDANSQENSATSPVDISSATLPDQRQSGARQFQTAPTNGTTSDLDKLFSKLIPAASPPPSTPNNKVTLETLFASASASASSTPSSNLVTPPLTTTNKGLTLLDSIFASATPPPGALPAPTPPPHHVSSEPFPPPPSVPPSTRPAFASAHPPGDSSEPDEHESSEPSSPSYHAAAQLIHSPQPTNSQLPQILTQDVISALLGMPPSRTSSVASSQRRYEGDIESSDDLREVESPVEERPPGHANRARKHELGDVTPRPPLRGFASTEKVLPAPAPSSLPSHHSAPSVLPTAAASVPPVPAPCETAPTIGSAPTTGPAPIIGLTPAAVAAPRAGTSPAPRALVPFHEESSLWPYPRAPLDDRDDIVELDFADTSALSDVDAFERRRQNGKNGAKMSKKNKAKVREEIERSWDVPGNTIPPNADTGLSHVVLGRPSTFTPSPQPGLVNAKQPNLVPAPVNNTAPPSTGGQAATAPPCGNNNNKSKAAKSKSIPNGPNAQVVSVPPATTQANGAALTKPAASAAIVEAVRNHNHPNGNGSASLPTTTADRNGFVREVLTLIHTDSSFVERLWAEYRARA